MELSSFLLDNKKRFLMGFRSLHCPLKLKFGTEVAEVKVWIFK